jgi:pyruvate kinase
VLARGVNDTIRLSGPKERLLRAAALLAQDMGDSGIVVFTKTGSLPWTLAGLRARGVPIYGFTDVPPVFRQMLLPWGVEPFFMELSGDPEETIARALLRLRERGWCHSGQWLVVITNVLASGSVIDTIQLRQVP